LVLTLGGDGALLHAVRRHLELGLPFAGVNLGAVGFNSTIDPDALPAALDRWREGRAEYEERFTVEARLHRVAGGIERAVALNEVLFSRRSAQQLVRIELRQGESLVLRLHADGIIIATPTGSTAHSLSAGGPVVHPALRSFVVTGLAPYSLSHRPIALPPEPSLRLRWTTRAEEAPCAIALDGQEHWPTEPGDELEMAAGPPVRLIRGEGADYFDSLRKKLNWCDSIRPIEG
jgi:NAD+ kinase